jgi:hypothetical protein
VLGLPDSITAALFDLDVDRVGQRKALLEHGADVVVDDLSELL